MQERLQYVTEFVQYLYFSLPRKIAAIKDIYTYTSVK